MREQIFQVLFTAIRAAICGKAINADVRQIATEDCLNEVLELAAKHDIAHLIVQGLSREVSNQALVEAKKKIPLLAVYRHERTNYELSQLCEVLEKNKIAYLPLKGAIIRQYYPEPWMRTSCDIDVLVHEEDLSRAVACLVHELGYVVQAQFTHDVSLFSKSNVHVELHFGLIENTVSQQAADILKDVWQYSHLKEGCEYHYEMSYEMLYFYHIAHMAKHFEGGGCGIRPYIDLWLLDQIPNQDKNKRDALLQRGGLARFAESCLMLSKVWLENQPISAVTEKMQRYIIFGGVYGNDENRILVQQQQKGGALGYALSKIIIPYDIIKFHYPILQKQRWLTPIMQVRRWGKLIFGGHAKKSMKELSYNGTISKSDADEMKKFLDEIGL